MRSARFKPLRAVLTLCVLALVTVLAACGGSDEDPTEVVQKAFSTPIESANVALNFTAEVEGVEQLSEPVELQLSGPFQSNGREKLPSLNWEASASGGGQAISGGIISTGDNAYVVFQGQNYEVGEEQVSQINQQLASQTQGQSLQDLGIDPASWLSDPQTEGDEEVNGADTTHVTAGIDVAKMLTDLNQVAEQTSGAMGQAAPQQLPQEQIDMITQVVQNPKMDVYAGKDDDALRRLNFSVDFEIPEDQRGQFQGATGGNITFSLDLSEVGEEQTIEAPADARPLSELQGAFGGAGATTPDSGSGSGADDSASGGSGSDSGSGSGSQPTAEDFERYSQCLEQADPSDQAAIQECAEILK